MKGFRFPLTFISICILFIACSTSKNIPEGSYLLDNITVKHDTHNATSDLELFLKQHPNSSFPLLGKMGLKIYNSAGSDTTKRKNRILRKIGQAPVIYSPKKTELSANELLKEAQNQGYLNATIDTSLKIKDNKISVQYNLHGGTPYRVRNYSYSIEDTTMARIMRVLPFKPAIEKGARFDFAMLEEERLRVNLIMRNAGYFNFAKDYAYFKADTTLNSHEVDLFLNIYPTNDSVPHQRSKFNKLTVISGISAKESTNLMQGVESDRKKRKGRNKYIRHTDTTVYRGITIIRGRSKFLRNSTIAKSIYMKSNVRYSDLALSKTFEAFNGMGAVKQVNITTSPAPEDSIHKIDATVLLTPANPHWFRASLDGTNSAGDIGVAPKLSYQHQNIFNGSEQLAISLKGAYEFIAGKNATDPMSQNFYEYGGEVSLTFPEFLVPWLKKKWRELPSAQTRFSVGYNKQHRQEYTRDFFNFTTEFSWRTNHNRFHHAIDLFDINYIRMPSVSHRFDSLYLKNPKNPMLAESYKDQLIARTAYSFTMLNPYRFNKLAPTYSFRSTIEVSGYLPRLATAIGSKSRDAQGQRRIFDVAYAEYLKATFDFAKTYYFSQRHSLAYHVGLGIAHPYGNSKVLPFERRFFAGGANSVRGWSTRKLGPGSYHGANDKSDFVNQSGDFKLEFSVENRMKVTDLFELAQFFDAGNIWTLKKYPNQPGGQLKAKTFYKEIAMSYGTGIRLDLSFLLLRLDWGLQIYNPGLNRAKFVMFKPRWSRMAFHFGIGYPF